MCSESEPLDGVRRGLAFPFGVNPLYLKLAFRQKF
jgi:hypothetical protein